jgi:hypothetical protein
MALDKNDIAKRIAKEVIHLTIKILQLKFTMALK